MNEIIYLSNVSVNQVQLLLSLHSRINHLFCLPNLFISHHSSHLDSPYAFLQASVIIVLQSLRSLSHHDLPSSRLALRCPPSLRHLRLLGFCYFCSLRLRHFCCPPHTLCPPLDARAKVPLRLLVFLLLSTGIT